MPGPGARNNIGAVGGGLVFLSLLPAIELALHIWRKNKQFSGILSKEEIEKLAIKQCTFYRDSAKVKITLRIVRTLGVGMILTWLVPVLLKKVRN